MQAKTSICFGTYRVDRADERLYRGKKPLVLPPKAFAVLRYLLEHAGQLVTKDELLDAVWPDVAVSEGVLKVSVRQLRKALGEKAQTPRFIETVHRRGYRFIAPLTSSPLPLSRSKFKVQSSNGERVSGLKPFASSVVGREPELTQLQDWLERALEGERQVVLVTGEVGIGKTTLVETFMAQVGANGELWVGRGQCVEQYGVGEAYLPVLEALGRLCREPGGEQLITLLSQHAPTWLVQMPALLSASDLEALQHKVMGATKERMLREMAEAVEVLSAERPLVLTLEDLHWSDHSTLELLATLARRRERARLLVLGTYRPVDVIVREHPLKAVKQELALHGQCEELSLAYLTEAAVGEYLAGRFGKSQVPAELTRLIHQRTDGNPLFMVNAVDYAVRQGLVVQADGGWELKGKGEDIEVEVPETLRQMVERQLDRLTGEERRVLEVASVAGMEFSAAAVAAGMEEGIVEVEEQCEELVRQGHFIQSEGIQEWPDGTVASQYRFVHALYQEVLYERVAAARRVQLHWLIGVREERGYGEQAGEIAAELAMHFERGRDTQRAVQYLQQAGKNASQRSANKEAVSHLTKGLELLKMLPDNRERAQQELMLQSALGRVLMATQGYAAPAVGKVFARARELCAQMGETPQLFPVLWGLSAFYIVRGEYQTANELGKQMLRLAQSVQDPALLLEAHHVLGQILYFLGEIVPAREYVEQGITIYDPQQHHSHAFLYGHDPGVACQGYAAYALWCLGYPDQALKRSHEALSLAQGLSHPYSVAYARLITARLHQLRQEGQTTQEQAEALISISIEQGFTLFVVVGPIMRGWALAQQGQGEEGIAQIRQGLTAFSAMGAELYTRGHFLALLAEAYGRTGQQEEALNVLAEALAVVDKTGERYYEAEIYRLKGELTLQANTQSPDSRITEAETCFQQALKIARQQEAKSWELRTATSLARLWQGQGKQEEARDLLAPVYNWFTEGFDTKDLQDAKTLLEELS